jgi:predicted small secreted protein
LAYPELLDLPQVRVPHAARTRWHSDCVYVVVFDARAARETRSRRTRRPFMYSRFIAILVALATLGLTACNTMQGLGQDIERGGEKLQDSAKKAKD